MTGHQTAMFNMFQDGRTEVVCDRFEILDNSRKLLFFAESNEIGLKLDNLRILGMVLAMVFQLSSGLINFNFNYPTIEHHRLNASAS